MAADVQLQRAVSLLLGREAAAADQTDELAATATDAPSG
jgi:hypothetical protein